MSKINKMYKGVQLLRLASLFKKEPDLFRCPARLIEVLKIGDYEFSHGPNHGEYILISNPERKKQLIKEAEEKEKTKPKNYKGIFISSFEDKNKPGYYNRKLPD